MIIDEQRERGQPSREHTQRNLDKRSHWRRDRLVKSSCTGHINRLARRVWNGLTSYARAFCAVIRRVVSVQ